MISIVKSIVVQREKDSIGAYDPIIFDEDLHKYSVRVNRAISSINGEILNISESLQRTVIIYKPRERF